MAEWEQKIRELQSANTICNFYCNHSLFKQNQGVNYFQNWSSHSSQQNDDHAKSKFKEAKTRVMLSWPPIMPEITRNEIPSCIISRKWTCSIDLQNKSTSGLVRWRLQQNSTWHIICVVGYNDKRWKGIKELLCIIF